MYILDLDVLNTLRLPADEPGESDIMDDNTVEEAVVTIGIKHTVRVIKLPCHKHIAYDVHAIGLQKWLIRIFP